MPNLIDTHTHLYDKAFNPDREEVIRRAREAGVIALILPAIEKEAQKDLLKCESQYRGYAFSTFGLHPTSVKSDWEQELQFVINESTKSGYIAVGEIGMDGYWSREYMREQAIVFEEQLKLASKLSLPVIIHSRDSYEEIFTVLERCKSMPITGVFHSFSGSIEIYRRLRKYGDFKVGIGGVVTYKGAKIAETVKEIGIENIILETDSPWLTPVPHRGKRNEPSHTKIVAQKLAAIFNIEIDEISSLTTNSAIELFKLNEHINLT